MKIRRTWLRYNHKNIYREIHVHEHTLLSWLLLSLRRNSSMARGNCKGFPDNFFCSMRFRFFHSFMKLKIASWQAGFSLTKTEVHSLGLVDISSNRKFSDSDLGAKSSTSSQVHKWTLPVYWLTYEWQIVVDHISMYYPPMSKQNLRRPG